MPTEGEIKHFRNPFPTTDIIIEYKNCTKEGIVLIERRNPPYGLAIPGGFAEYGLSLEQNAKKEAMEETGLEVVIEDSNHPFCVRSAPDRDPRAHMISITYIAKGYGRLEAGDDAAKASLYSIDEVIGMLGKNLFAFDHEIILCDYLKHRGYIPALPIPENAGMRI